MTIQVPIDRAHGGRAPTLGVRRSALGRSWRDRLDTAGEAHALAMMQQHGLGDLVARVLAARGVTAPTAQAYLDPSLRASLPDPDCLTDMGAAVDRLTRAVVAGESVAIFGDYDVDGATAAALMAGFLRQAGITFDLHIPDRIVEGYGPNVEAIRGFAGRGAGLLVTVDCGSTSHAPIEEATRLGLDTVVIDHHQVPSVLPSAHALVNPNRPDDLSGLGHLCAAGVVFMVLVGLNRRLRQRGFWTAARPEPDLLGALDLVALGTVADVVPLVGLNRAFVAKGLAVMRARGRPGLTALVDVSGVRGPPRPYHLGFLLGPRINAGGRIGDSTLGAKLLLEADDIRAGEIAAMLDRLNRERRVVESATLEAAEAEAEAALARAGRGAAIVVAGAGWHPGVVGLVAARLRERHSRPAFAIALDGETGTGSGRSVPGVDLGSAVREAVALGLAIKGGGHAMAAGVTIAAANIAAFGHFLEERLASAVLDADARDGLDIDASLTAGGVTAELAGQLERAGPFGSGNPEPVFALAAHRVLEVGEVGTGHVRFVAASGDGSRIGGIAFRASGRPLGQLLATSRGAPLHLAGTVGVDHGGAGDRAQLRLVDAADPTLGSDAACHDRPRSV